MSLPIQLQGRLRLPVVASPMFLASGPELVIGACRAGVLGTFPALNQRTTEAFDEWLCEIDEALAVPPGEGEVAAAPYAVHSYGGLVFHDVTGAHHAAKAAEAGVDGIIGVSAGAGGHAGALNPFALVADIRRVWDGTLLLAGALSTGRDVLAAQAAGADLAYLGTRFLATDEAMVSDGYKEMLTTHTAQEIVYTPSISSIPASFLRGSIVAAGLDPERLAQPEKVDLHHVTNPHASEAKEHKAWRDIWSAGQGVAAIDDVVPVARLVDRLADEYEQAKGDLLAVLGEAQA